MDKSQNNLESQMLGIRVKQARLNKNLSVVDLAELVGVSKAYIHQIESGDCGKPSAQVLFNVARILGTSIGYLLGKIDQSNLEPGTIDIPDELRQFAAEEGLSTDDIDMLARIKYRDKKPKDASDWKYIWESIKRSVNHDK